MKFGAGYPWLGSVCLGTTEMGSCSRMAGTFVVGMEGAAGSGTGTGWSCVGVASAGDGLLLPVMRRRRFAMAASSYVPVAFPP